MQLNERLAWLNNLRQALNKSSQFFNLPFLKTYFVRFVRSTRKTCWLACAKSRLQFRIRSVWRRPVRGGKAGRILRLRILRSILRFLFVFFFIVTGFYLSGLCSKNIFKSFLMKRKRIVILKYITLDIIQLSLN